MNLVERESENAHYKCVPVLLSGDFKGPGEVKGDGGDLELAAAENI